MKISEMVRAAVRPWVSLHAEDGHVCATIGDRSLGLSVIRDQRRVEVSIDHMSVASVTWGAKVADQVDGEYILYRIARSSWSGPGVELVSNPVATCIRSARSSRERWSLSLSGGWGCPFEWGRGKPTWETAIGGLKVKFISAEDNRAAHEDWKRRDDERKAQAATAEAS